MTNEDSTEMKLDFLKKLTANASESDLTKILKLINDTDIEVKLIAIEKLTHFNNYNQAKNELFRLANDKDCEIRYYAIEALSSFSGEDVGTLLISKLNDPSEIVRMTVLEILGEMDYKEAIPYLVEILSDTSELVRGYAAESLGKIGNTDLISILKNKLKIESRNAARLGYYIGLYRLGEIHYFDKILSMLKVRSYRVRCATANSLIDLVNKNNINEIIQALENALSIETTVAAKSSISNALNELYKK